MADDFSRGLKIGCGAYFGWMIASAIVGVVSLVGVFFACCGGCTLLTGTAAKVASDSVETRPVAVASNPIKPTSPEKPVAKFPLDDGVIKRTTKTEPKPTPEEIAAKDKAEQEARRMAAEKAIAEMRAEAERTAAAKVAKDEEYAATLFNFARKLADSGDKALARKSLNSLIAQYPKTKAAAEARKLLAELK